VLAKSNQEVEVQSNQTILQAIETFNINIECLCCEGECSGICETDILEGEAEHFDQKFSDAKKTSQKNMVICVLLAKSKKANIRYLIHFCGRSIV